jgi:hypothetical protein
VPLPFKTSIKKDVWAIKTLHPSDLTTTEQIGSKMATNAYLAIRFHGRHGVRIPFPVVSPIELDKNGLLLSRIRGMNLDVGVM